MSKKIKDQEVLLVKDQKDDSLRAVVGADGKSGLKLHSLLYPPADRERIRRLYL